MQFPTIFFITSLAIGAVAQQEGSKATCNNIDGPFDYGATLEACKLYKENGACKDCEFKPAGDAHCESVGRLIEINQWIEWCQYAGAASGFIPQP